ncbi:hypothetical protein [Niabella ginsengisoli]|uniref:TonB-dependent receptor plug domain-containing protein n=1 Tax=Niabella ginsengisoli TaxID=522298 RepID=A0ABS9SGD5_9BACT|nr:hypothetical protein [Niabella ginsengisoli]MCH5597381.1 hypothetical protein [Niabella ginsengisoli]
MTSQGGNIKMTTSGNEIVAKKITMSEGGKEIIFQGVADGQVFPEKNLKGKVSGVQIKPSTGIEEVVVVGYPAKSDTRVLSNPPANAYYVLNGEHVKQNDINRLAPNTIKSIDVLKGDTAKKFYGDKAKEGAIIITTK